MSIIISITDLRRNLFNLAEQVFSSGEEIEVEKEGRRIVKIVRIDDDPKERAKRMLVVMKKIGGKFKNVDFDKDFFMGKKEKEYMKKLGQW